MADAKRPLPSFGTIALVAAILYAAYNAREALTPFVLAAAFTYILNPAVTFFEAKGFRRLPVIAAGYLAALVLVAAGYYALKPIAVELTRRDAAGKQVHLHTLKPGEFFGEMALLESLPRTATATATETSRLHLLYRTKLDGLLSAHPRIGVAIMRHLARLLSARLRRAINDYTVPQAPNV